MVLVVPHSMVQTHSGFRSIEQVAAGDQMCEVMNLWTMRTEYLSIEVHEAARQPGVSIITYPWHRLRVARESTVMTMDNRWMRAADIRPHDYLRAIDRQQTRRVRVAQVESEKLIPLVRVEVPEDHAVVIEGMVVL